jgi:hypothetical protein
MKNKDKIPRIAEGKYLKLLYELHEKSGTLNTTKENLTIQLCPKCDLSNLCKDEDHEGKLTVYCLEGMFIRK